MPPMHNECPRGPAEKLVDVHAHFVTDDYRAAAQAAGYIHPDGMTAWPTWNVDEHLRLMDSCGIRTSMLSISSPGVHFGNDIAARTLARTVNDFGSAVTQVRPERFGLFAALPLPDVSGSLIEAAYALDELGADGVAVETNSRGLYLGDERFDPLWQELNRRKCVVFVHPTSPPGYEKTSLGRPRPMLEFIFDSTRAASDLLFAGTLNRYPDIEWIFTHTGGTLPLLADRLELFQTLFMTESNSSQNALQQIGRLWFDMAGTPFPHSVPALIAAFGSERLLYGSDYCWTPAAGAAAQVASVDAAKQPPGDSWRALTTRNAGRLLSRTDALREQYRAH
ncbi:amidohydrolase family protein [Subtercola boreus]|nr:amidohydrolase family protein [Subtercola boreus]